MTLRTFHPGDSAIHALERAGWSQREIAGEIGVTVGEVSRWLRGERGVPLSVTKLAEILLAGKADKETKAARAARAAALKKGEQ